MQKITIGSRKSVLARIQAYTVAAHLKAFADRMGENLEVDFLFKSSFGDQNLEVSLKELPEKGLFTKDLQEDLANGSCDLVVHSWKDLPLELPPTHSLVGTMKREDARDLLLVKKSFLTSLSSSSATKTFVVLSSSPRREYNLSKLLPEILPFDLDKLSFKVIRGNIPTRLSKLLADPEAQALVLAKAALDRLMTSDDFGDEEIRSFKASFIEDLEQCEWMILPLRENPTAPAQGALAIEAIDDGGAKVEFLKSAFQEFQSVLALVQKEREVLAEYGGGCHQKIGAHVRTIGPEEKAYLLLKGERDSGQILDCELPTDLWRKGRALLIDGKNFVETSSSLSRKDIWPPEDLRPRFFDRQSGQSGPLDLTRFENVLVTRKDAYRDDLVLKENVRIWVSGMQTWRALAQKNVWVSGSLESFGSDILKSGVEASNVALSTVAFSTVAFSNMARLTHDKAPTQDGATNVMTYSLKARFATAAEAADSLPAADKKLCFWMSASAFLEVWRLDQELIASIPRHACGMGLSFDELAPIFEKMNRKLEPYIDLKDCVRQNTKWELKTI